MITDIDTYLSVAGDVRDGKITEFDARVKIRAAAGVSDPVAHLILKLADHGAQKCRKLAELIQDHDKTKRDLRRSEREHRKLQVAAPPKK